jgi:hypothetical protein
VAGVRRLGGCSTHLLKVKGAGQEAVKAGLDKRQPVICGGEEERRRTSMPLIPHTDQ